MEDTELEWLALSSQERTGPTKAIYEILRSLHRIQGGRFDDLFEEAQGLPLTQGIDPYSNIKRGIYDRHKMRTIHEWLATNHFEFAQSKAPHLFKYPRRDPWDAFLEKHAVEGRVQIIPAEQFGIASRRPPQDGLPVFRLGQKYIFALLASEPAFVVAFEEYEGKWYPLALGDTEKDLIRHVGTGTTKLPSANDGTSIPLMEHDHTGLHRFVFVQCSGRKPPTGRDALIAYAGEQNVIVSCVSMRVTG